MAQLDADSAVKQELHTEFKGWSTRIKTNMLLADIVDKLAMINANLVAVAEHKRAKKPEEYPRPWKKKKDNGRHFGAGALPPDELRAWIAERRREHGND